MNKKNPTIFLICGFIGSGKSTYSMKLEEKTGAIRITKDEWSIRLKGNNPTFEGYAEWDHKITALSRDVAFQLAEKGVNVILDEGFWERRTRDEMRRRAERIGAQLEMYYLDVPIQVMKKRALERNNLTKESFIISSDMFDAYLRYWEPPTDDEQFIRVV